MLHVPEILSHGKPCLSHAHTCPGRLIHLSEYQGRLIQNPGLAHLCPKVISLTGTLTHAGEYGISAVLSGNIGDQFLDQYGLAHAGSAEQADLSALCIGSQQINYLDACLQHLHHRALVLKGGRVPVDHPFIFMIQALSAVNRLPKDIK